MTEIERMNQGAAVSMALDIQKYKKEVTAASVIADTKEFYAYLNSVSQEIAGDKTV